MRTTGKVPAEARLALLFPGTVGDPRTWSGTPAGLASGLRAAGVRVVVPVRAEPPFGLDTAALYLVAALRLPRTAASELGSIRALSRAVARASPELAALYTWAARAGLRRAGPLDAAVQIGAGYSPTPAGLPIVTFEDLTVLQAIELGYPEWRLLSRKAIAARVARQQRVYEHARACCLTTRWAAESVVRDYGIAPEKVHAVGVGRNLDPRPVPRDWSCPRFLFIGRGWEAKNGPRVLRAFAELRNEAQDARLDVVGDHPPIDAEGVAGHGLLRLADEGDRRRLERLYESATCFVLPSRYEAAGIVYVEAAAAGISSIGTTAGGCAELIGAGGRVVGPDDEAALVDAMRELADPETAARLGKLAEERAALFTWRAVAERLLRALDLPSVPTDSFAHFLDEPEPSPETGET